MNFIYILSYFTYFFSLIFFIFIYRDLQNLDKIPLIIIFIIWIVWILFKIIMLFFGNISIIQKFSFKFLDNYQKWLTEMILFFSPSLIIIYLLFFDWIDYASFFWNIWWWLIFTWFVIILFEVNLFASKIKPKILWELFSWLIKNLINLKENYYDEIKDIVNDVNNILKEEKIEKLDINLDYIETKLFDETNIINHSKSYLEFSYLIWWILNIEISKNFNKEIHLKIKCYKEILNKIDENKLKDIKNKVNSFIEKISNDTNYEKILINHINDYINIDIEMSNKEKTNLENLLFIRNNFVGNNIKNEIKLIIWFYLIYDFTLDKIKYYWWFWRHISKYYQDKLFLFLAYIVINLLFFGLLIVVNWNLTDFFDNLFQSTSYWMLWLFVVLFINLFRDFKFYNTQNDSNYAILSNDSEKLFKNTKFYDLYNILSSDKFKNFIKSLEESIANLYNFNNFYYSIKDNLKKLDSESDNIRDLKSKILKEISNRNLDKIENISQRDSLRDLSNSFDLIEKEFKNTHNYIKDIQNTIDDFAWDDEKNIYDWTFYKDYESFIKQNRFKTIETWNYLLKLFTNFSVVKERKINLLLINILQDLDVFSFSENTNDLDFIQNQIESLKKTWINTEELEKDYNSILKRMPNFNINLGKNLNILKELYKAFYWLYESINNFDKILDEISSIIFEIVDTDFLSILSENRLNILDRWWKIDYINEFDEHVKDLLKSYSFLYYYTFHKELDNKWLYISNFILNSSIMNKDWSLVYEVIPILKIFNKDILIQTKLFLNELNTIFDEKVLYLYILTWLSKINQLSKQEDFVTNFEKYFIEIKDSFIKWDYLNKNKFSSNNWEQQDIELKFDKFKEVLKNKLCYQSKEKNI